MLFDLPCFTRGAERVGGSTVIDVTLGQGRQPCLELQRKVPGGWRSVLLSGLLSLARTNKSRRLGERRKATTGVSLKMLCNIMGIEWPSCFVDVVWFSCIQSFATLAFTSDHRSFPWIRLTKRLAFFQHHGH